MKVAAIVPAYNEETTITNVINVLKQSSLVDEVIVVSDGSIDGTVKIARKAGANVIDLAKNVGKGGAMKAGSLHTDANVYLFIDADLVGLDEQHISDLLKPVLQGTAEMSVGLFEHGRFATDLAQKVAPFLSGQRAIKKELFHKIPDIENSRFGVEMSLSRYADKHKTSVAEVRLHNLYQIMKEEKRGLVKGFAMRIKMYWEILRAARM